MGHRSSYQPLAIWANGDLVGRWAPTTRRPMELRYADSWLASSAARPLSLSLPLPLVGNEPLRGERVRSFFDNLLPDSAAIRRRLAQRYAAGSEDTFDWVSMLRRPTSCALPTTRRFWWSSASTAKCTPRALGCFACPKKTFAKP